jgi:hypothetical protein
VGVCGVGGMSEQSEFIKDIRAAVEHLFAHRKTLGRVAVRFAFWPDGLVISFNITARNREELTATRQEIVSWDRLASVDPAEFMGIVDRVCQPAHDLLRAKDQS